MGELMKGTAAAKNKNKAEKSKPNPEERRTSARITADGRKTKSTNEESAPSNKQSDGNKVDGSPSTEQSNGPKDVGGAVSEAGGDGKAGVDSDTASRADLEKPKEGNDNDKADRVPQDQAKISSADTSESGLPETPNHTDRDGDVIMNDRPRGNAHGQTTSIQPLGNSSPAAPASAKPASTSAANASSTSNDSPPLAPPPPAISAPASSARSTTPTLLPSDEGAPAYLTPAMLARLRGVSPAAAWQNLVTVFVQFEKASPPSGKLSTTARPKEVAPWIKRHINKKHEPVSVSSDYGSRLQTWWKAIQPSWRTTTDGSLSRDAPAKEMWASLKKGGSAGLYIVVVALSWWVATLKAGSDDSQVWAIADDIAWVISLAMPTTHPAIFESTSVKRASPDTPGDDATESPPSKRVKA